MTRGRFLRLMGIFLILSALFFIAGVSAGPGQEGSDGVASGTCFVIGAMCAIFALIARK